MENIITDRDQIKDQNAIQTSTHEMKLKCV